MTTRTEQTSHPTIYNWIGASNKHGKPVLRGQVQNRDGYKDGETVITSPIVKIVDDGMRYLVHTASGSIYRLGWVNSNFEKRCPNARNMVITKFLEQSSAPSHS